jgi:hypothetical protein
LIDFRYFIVSIVAVFLALAIGIVLGTTTINHALVRNLGHQAKQVTTTNEHQQATIERLQHRISADEDFAAAVGPTIVDGELARESVALVSAPRVDSGTRSKTRKLVRASGATVASDVRLKSSYVDPGKAAALSAVAAGLAEHTGLHLPAGARATTKAAAVLASVLVTPADAQVSSDDFATTIAAFRNGGLVTIADDHPRPATLALVLTGPPPKKHAKSTRAALLALARTLDKHGAGAVLAGPEPPAGKTKPTTRSAVATARNQQALTAKVSTVDNVNTPQGQLAVVLALAEQLHGHTGQYGSAGGATAPIPSPIPSAIPTTGPPAHGPSTAGP